MSTHAIDQLGRALTDLRVSVTDRCNFRCTYCMPRERFGPDHAFLERDELLSFEEIATVARVLADLGLRKVRLTGGEPLVRRDLPRLVELIARIEGIDDLALTTNGSLLPRHAGALAEAGLDRVSVSLDSLD
ncbi:MAG: radical SAM protein, partial [Actinomycetota bacterium]